jgi:CO/xanthine dehydrogenase FAD-binding subunit
MDPGPGANLREAIDLLASNPEASVIAGGQSVMPVLAFRLATPSLLVDLRRLPGLLLSAMTVSGSARSYAGATLRTISG